MISRVKPLHTAVEKTSQSVEHAQHKMKTLEGKRKVLIIEFSWILCCIIC